MRVGVFGRSTWHNVCTASGLDMLPLERAVELPANPFDANLQARLDRGREMHARLTESPVDLLIDDDGAGLQFTVDSNAGGRATLALLHEEVKTPLVSHFRDPIGSALRGVPLPMMFQALASGLWIKLVWDRPHALELQRFGVPNVVHAPMGAPHHDYDTSPLKPENLKTPVAFIGAQTSRYYTPGMLHEAAGQRAGLLGLLARQARPELSFYDVYYELYGVDTPPSEADTLEQKAAKFGRYNDAKLAFIAANQVAQRDRFIVFLKHQLGDHFRVIGNNWDSVWGLATEPRVAGYDAYLRSFRECLINLNCVTGSAETAVNLRTFEVTAAGGFLLHAWRPELAEYFEIGREIDVFRDEMELLEKVRDYMANPGKAVEIARAGQQRTHRDHMNNNRLAAIVKMLREAGALKAA